MSGVLPDPRGAGEQRRPHGSDWPSIREAGWNPDAARVRRDEAGSKRLWTAQANAWGYPPSNAPGPQRGPMGLPKTGTSRGLAGLSTQRAPYWLRRRVRSYGRVKRISGTREPACGSPWWSIRGAGANRMRTPTGLPEKPTPPGKPADTLTQARWAGW